MVWGVGRRRAAALGLPRAEKSGSDRDGMNDRRAVVCGASPRALRTSGPVLSTISCSPSVFFRLTSAADGSCGLRFERHVKLPPDLFCLSRSRSRSSSGSASRCAEAADGPAAPMPSCIRLLHAFERFV